MKNNIKQLLDSYISDSKDFIFENADTVANFLIEDTRSYENGYLFFLEEDEKEKV